MAAIMITETLKENFIKIANVYLRNFSGTSLRIKCPDTFRWRQIFLIRHAIKLNRDFKVKSGIC